MTRPLFVVSLVATLAAATLTGCTRGKAAAPDAGAAAAPIIDLPVVTVTTGRIESALEISGTLTPRTRVGVKPKMPGSLERIMVDLGDVVREGQVVATLDRREIDAQADAASAAVGVARAGLDSADAGLGNATTERERARNLFEKGAVPRQRLDAAETAFRAATAQRDLARASLLQAEAALRRATEVQRNASLTAPVSGHVVARNYDPGAIPGEQPVVVVADISLLKLEAGVSELDAGRLKLGQPADVVVQAKPGAHYRGELAAIAPEVDERNRHFQIEIRVPNGSTGLLSGMYATARIITDAADGALLLPRDAVGTRNGVRVVLKVTGDQVTAVPVTEGLQDGRRVQILTGLASGDRVVADARRQVADGVRVRAVAVN